MGLQGIPPIPPTPPGLSSNQGSSTNPADWRNQAENFYNFIAGYFIGSGGNPPPPPASLSDLQKMLSQMQQEISGLPNDEGQQGLATTFVNSAQDLLGLLQKYGNSPSSPHNFPPDGSADLAQFLNDQDTVMSALNDIQYWT
jgi:hypothetical protein